MITPRRYNQGDRLVLTCQCYDTSDVAAWPDALVTAKIYDGSGNLDKSVDLSPLDKFKYTGLFYNSVLIDLDPGKYTVFIPWAVSSNNRSAFDAFEVLNAGDTEGGVSEVYDHLGPGAANGIIYQTETGKISFGRNPR